MAAHNADNNIACADGLGITGTKPKVYRDGQYSDPVYKKLSKINGEINKLQKIELQCKLRELGLDSSGLKDVLKKRLKNYYKKRKLIQTKNFKGRKTKYDYLAVIDFEATCEENCQSYRHEIIEFPIVLIDVEKMEIVDSFQEYVRPLVNPKLTKFCTQLTGITQEVVDKADIFPVVLNRVEEWLDSRMNSGEFSFAVLTDGPWDMFRFMFYQCKESKIDMPSWSKQWVNIRKAYCNFYQCSRGGIETMLTSLGMTFEGSPHSGIDDAQNIARIAMKLLSDGCGLNVNEHIVIKCYRDCQLEAKYEPYHDNNCVDNDDEEEEVDNGMNQERSHREQHTIENDNDIVNKMHDICLDGHQENIQQDGDDLDDLLTYYKLQKS